MAAAGYAGPVMVQEQVAAPAMSLAAEPVGEIAYNAPARTMSNASAMPKPDADDDAQWDSSSLCDEILDQVEAFQYSHDGEPYLGLSPSVAIDEQQGKIRAPPKRRSSS